MEIKTTKTIEETVHIELPYYLKGSCHAYKVISEENCISVCHGLDSNLEIALRHVGLAFSSPENNTPCTEAEFNELYNATLKKLTDARN